MRKFALAGNPNSGKTTLFNALTGSTAHVGNWPGVTVDKREGVCKRCAEPVAIVDLPGIYSLSPYTPEEVIARSYILEEKPDCIIDIVDATNLERNLYLTTQLLETDVPVVVALNMCDAVRKNGDKIDVKKLERELGVPVAAISALKGEGIDELLERALSAAARGRQGKTVLEGSALGGIIGEVKASLGAAGVPNALFCAVKLVEGDEREEKAYPAAAAAVRAFRTERAADLCGEDPEALAADARYKYIAAHFAPACERAAKGQPLSRSDKADRVLTHRIWGIPLFLAILFAMFHLTFGTDFLYLNTIVGWFNGGAGFAFDADTGNEVLNALTAVFFTADGISTPGAILFNLTDFITSQIGSAIALGMEASGAAPWAQGLVNEGIWGGVASVLSFVPQILTLFLFLSVLEDSGYMARVAFILDRAFRKFGLTGRAFIPMIMGFGCSVPAAVNTRTLADEKERTMTNRVIPFFTCGAKAPILAAVCGAIAAEYTGVSPDLLVFALYVFGMAMAIIMVAIMRQTTMRGEVAPFIMELPAYHAPQFHNLMVHMWDKLKHYIKKAFTIILASSIVIWFLQNFSWQWQMVSIEESILHDIGSFLTWLCTPMGFGLQLEAGYGWVFAVAAVVGLIAKENVIAAFYIIAVGIGFADVGQSEDGIAEVVYLMGQTGITWQGLIAYTVFNMLTVPCFAAAATVKAETPKGKFRYTVAFWMLTSYVTATVVYLVLTWWWTAIIVAAVAAAFIAYVVLRNKGVIGRKVGSENLF